MRRTHLLVPVCCRLIHGHGLQSCRVCPLSVYFTLPVVRHTSLCPTGIALLEYVLYEINSFDVIKAMFLSYGICRLLNSEYITYFVSYT